MKAILAALAVVAIGVAVSGEQAARADNESPVRLLPGYNHRSVKGIDSSGGRIWRDRGPDIHYDIGLLVGEHAKGYVDENPRLSLITVDAQATGDIAVAIDEKHDRMVVTVDRTANFSARNVRSRKDVVEVLLMANSVKRIPR